ncbi:helix-turn-helix domain-containing protein [Geomonas azotofigens]|uniref:helix-turn-helix domain-containing protein n=1 Tax=Geomonas azotofigens TaxID=2843196 RepID=UPI001C0F85FF|nr:helix-turn-helix domain-containing protein [Geomonas azotofigens]MBU5613819.1 helix-turn-helix domain-containing protein [Geomonas azotofigens]
MEITREFHGKKERGLPLGMGGGETSGVRARKPADKVRYRLQIIDEALSLLALIFQSGSRMNLAEVIAASGMTKNKTFRMLTTMEYRGVIDKDRDGRYHFGMNTFMVARRALTRIELPEAVPFLRELALLLNEEVYLARKRDGQTMLVAVANSRQKVTVRSYLGLLLPEPPGCPAIEGAQVTEGVLDPEITTVAVDLPPFGDGEFGALVVVAPTFRMAPERVRTEVIPALRKTVGRMGRLSANSVLRTLQKGGAAQGGERKSRPSRAKRPERPV